MLSGWFALCLVFISGELVLVTSAVVGLHGKGWNISTLGDTLSGRDTLSGHDTLSERDTLSGCVTQDPRVDSSEGCGIHPSHPVGVVACTSEP